MIQILNKLKDSGFKKKIELDTIIISFKNLISKNLDKNVFFVDNI